jgi:hypothetical protein
VSGDGVLLACPLDRGDHVDFGGGGVPGFACGFGGGWLLVVVLWLVGVAGGVFGVGEAGVDGVVEVEALAVPAGDDGSRPITLSHSHAPPRSRIRVGSN